MDGRPDACLDGGQTLNPSTYELLAGIHDVLCKSLGSSNAINVARATINGLKGLKRPDEIAKLRGLSPEEFVPKGLLDAYNESERGPLVVDEVK